MTSTSPEAASDSGISPDQKEEFERMERWLDEHPEFVHDYFARKAKRSMVDGWLIAHALSHSGLSLQTDSLSTSSGSNSKPSSGANTPVRKISAQEFDKGGLLKPIVSTVDGLPTFLGPTPTPTISQPKTHRRSRSELKALDEKELMYELVIDICNDLDVRSLCYKILQNLCILLNADRCSLFLVQGRGTNEKWLVSQLFDVCSDSTFEDVTSEDKEEIRIPLGTGIIGYVGQTGEVVNIPDAYEDPRFNREIDLRMGYKTRSILCMPIKDSEGEVIGVAQAINKITAIVEPFNEHDEKIFASYLAFCGIGLKNAQMYERSLLENRRNQVLLDLARVIFEEQSNVANLIHKIMMHTQSLLQCQRCQVLLVEDITKGLFSQVFDLQASDFDNDDTYNREGPQQPRFPINVGVTGYVAATGETVNLPDAYEDTRFDPAVDTDGFRTRALLCIPIKNAAGKVIGVTQLVNKLDGTPFTKNDENLLEAFSIFSGLGIQNTQMYETACKAMAKQRIALETLSYHAIAPPEEAQRLRKLPVPTTQHYGLLDYTFSDFALDDDDTLRATIRMFLDLDLMERFRINYDVFCRWLLSVKKNYRNVTYHNWRHAFNVTQTMFCMLKSDDLRNMMSETEQLALMVGCLCHDLDHRGTTNQFQIKTMSALSQLYSTSTMEHHHFDQCIMILNTKGNEIFCNLNQAEYEAVIGLLENAILSTDLALYFRYRGEFFGLVKKGQMNWLDDRHRELLRSMMMTASDVSAIAKPWEVQQKVAELVASEFFEQGDIERDELKLKPMAMMDRTQKDKLPALQVDFIDNICLPVYEAISNVFPKLDPLRHGCASNREHWQEMADMRSKQNTDMDCPEIINKSDTSDKQRQEASDTSDKQRQEASDKACAADTSQESPKKPEKTCPGEEGKDSAKNFAAKGGEGAGEHGAKDCGDNNGGSKTSSGGRREEEVS